MYVLGSHCKPEDGPVVKALCETFGVVQEIPERLMEACIGVMGSGPAYVSNTSTSLSLSLNVYLVLLVEIIKHHIY